MSGFSNSIIGGMSNLIRKAIQSPDYSPGVSGWTVNKDGSAEFNDATFRGTVVLDGTGTLLVYDTDGFLIVAISPAGGTSPDGQAYEKGIDTYDVDAGARTYEINMRDGVIIFNFKQSNVFLQRGLIQANQPLVASESPSLGMYAPSDNSDQLQGAVVTFGTSQDATDVQRVRVTGLDPADDNAPIATTLYVNGDVVLENTGDRITRGGIVAPTLEPGWSNFGGGFQGAGYIELPEHFGQLVGVVSGTPPGTIFTVPSALAPSATQGPISCACNNGKHAQVVVNTDGTVAAQNADTGVTWISLAAVRWPISGF